MLLWSLCGIQDAPCSFPAVCQDRPWGIRLGQRADAARLGFCKPFNAACEETRLEMTNGHLMWREGGAPQAGVPAVGEGKRQHCPHGLPSCCIPLWIHGVSPRKKQTKGLELGHIKPYQHAGNEAQQHHSSVMEINRNGAATALAHDLFIYLVMPATINRQWFPYCSLPPSPLKGWL